MAACVDGPTALPQEIIFLPLINYILKGAYGFFYILLIVQLVIILANNQIDALFHVFIYFTSLHVSSITVLIIRRSNCINTPSGMISLCDCLLCLTGVTSSHLHRLIIPNGVLIQFDLLMMSTVMLETCREMK